MRAELKPKQIDDVVSFVQTKSKKRIVCLSSRNLAEAVACGKKSKEG